MDGNRIKKLIVWFIVAVSLCFFGSASSSAAAQPCKEQALLSAKERLIAAFREHRETVDLSVFSGQLSKYDVTACFLDVLADKEFYYVGVPVIPAMKLTVRYYDQEKIGYSEENTKLLDEQIKKYTENIDDALTDLQKAGMIYDLIIETTEYRPGWTSTATTDKEYCIECSPLTVLCEGHGNCIGYSRAYSILLSELGVKNTIAGGVNSGGGHCWNQILIDDEWYNADVQIADSVNIKHYGNPYIAFLKSDKHFYEIGYRSNYDYQLCSCSSVKYDTERFRYTGLYWKTN